MRASRRRSLAACGRASPASARDGRPGRVAQGREQARARMRGRQQRRRDSGGAQARVEAADQRARAGHAVLPEQVEQHGRPVAALAGDGVGEGRLREHERLGLVEHAQLRRQAGLGRVLPQQARRQGVNRADLRPCGIHTGRQRALEPHGELARGGVGVGHDEHPLGRGARLQRRAHALDHERRLAGTRARGDDDLAARRDRRDLLVAEGEDGAHGFATRQTPCQRHHGGHSPPGGSCTHVAHLHAPGELPGALGGLVEQLVEELGLDVVAPGEALERAGLADVVAQQAARGLVAADRLVEAAHDVPPQQLGRGADVERHLQAAALEHVRAQRAHGAGLVVPDQRLGDPFALVDAIDASRDRHVAHAHAALGEGDLEVPRDELVEPLGLAAHDGAQIAPQLAPQRLPGDVLVLVGLDRDRLVDAAIEQLERGRSGAPAASAARAARTARR